MSFSREKIEKRVTNLRWSVAEKKTRETLRRKKREAAARRREREKSGMGRTLASTLSRPEIIFSLEWLEGNIVDSSMLDTLGSYRGCARAIRDLVKDGYIKIQTTLELARLLNEKL